MAGTVTHLAIAKRILDKLPTGTIKNTGLFYAGSIAPDAIHAKKDYVRDDKKKTHMRLKIRDDNFHEHENLNLFRNRVQEFIDCYFNPTDKNVDLYKGYVVHLLTDEIFMLTIRHEFSKQMSELGMLQSDKKFLEHMTHDIDNNDVKLIESHAYIASITKELEKLEPYEICDYLTEEQLNISRNWVINNKLKSNRKYNRTKYISFSKIENFIEKSAEEIVVRLFR